MASQQVELTTIATVIAGTDTGCTIYPDGDFDFAFGATEPAVFKTFNYVTDMDSLNYRGGYGSIWVKSTGSGDTVTLTVFLP